MFLPLTFWSGIFSSVARIQPPACGDFGWKMVSCPMFLISISKKQSEWANRIFAGKDPLVHSYYAFLKQTAWIYGSSILYEHVTHWIFSQWNRLRVSLCESWNSSLKPTSFSYKNLCTYCQRKFIFLQTVSLQQERNLFLAYNFLVHVSQQIFL